MPIETRAADGVQAEDGVIAHDRQIIDGVGGQELPIDRVAPHLIDADAVLINGEALPAGRCSPATT